jgi:DNA-binding NarL/FixJ family response regulator
MNSDNKIKVMLVDDHTLFRNGLKTLLEELLQSLLEGLKKEDSVEKNALSEREVDVLQHVCRGKSNIEIADEMCLSKRTVEKHRANIMEKTHCKNTASLVIFAVKNHLYEVK